MPFYDALKYILTTTSGKVKRISWNDHTYICRGFKNSCMSIVKSTTNSALFERFVATPDDLVADDWVIYYHEDRRI